MAIPRTQLKGVPANFVDERFFNALADLYTQAAFLIKQRAEQRLVRDARTLTVEARKQRALLVEVESILQQLDDEAARMVSEMIPPAYRQGVKQVTDGLKSIGFTSKLTSFDGKFHLDAQQLLMMDLHDGLTEAAINMSKGFRVALRKTQVNALLDKKITEEIAKGLVARSTRRQLSADIARRILDEYGDKPLLINGKTYDVGKYSEMVARTKTREAVTAGTVNRMVELGQDLVMVTSHGAKDGCGFYEGRVFSISGTSDRYPPLASIPNGGPPFHPNCLHNLAPFVDRLASGTERRRGADIDPKALDKPFNEVEKLARKAA